jgi:tRNA(Ile)-lysidine synthase
MLQDRVSASPNEPVVIQRAGAPRTAMADDASKREKSGHPFLDRIRDTLRRHHMLAGGETVIVVAASGGPDSTSLVYALATIGRDLGLLVHVAHLDHRLRPDAGADAAFVADTSRALGLPHHQDFADPKTLAAQEGLSLEDAGRRLRYEFLMRVARDVGATVVGTGHTMDDQAETVLMRLLRGSGLDGLRGIPPVRLSGGIRIIRPLIDTTRAEVESYLRAIGAGWREDSTNRDLAILRNRIRLVLLPALEGYNPDVRRTLARVAGLLRDEAEAIEVLAAASVGETLSGDSATVHVALEPFTRLPVALQRRALREAVRRIRGNRRAVRFVHIEGARRLMLGGQVGSWIPLPGGVRITRLPRGAEVAIEPAGRAPGVYRLPVPGRVVAIEFGVHVTAEAMTPDQLAAAGSDAGSKNAVVLDAARAGNELVVRGPQPGDRFAPAGMGGRTKLVADYLRDEKVPRHRRALIPVLATTDGVIMWIIGMRGSEAGWMTPATTRAVRVVARRLRA